MYLYILFLRAIVLEYNFNRPHQTLDYLAPIEYIERELAKIHLSACEHAQVDSPVLPMWSARTGP
ncbi:MAG: hypothetical protein DDT42_00577 [candidate division WS2 bacterium]|uniref:Integrase catalytic domain-containing protein n=1 Tax=Psychracetigena formicireducens TaxID=2986056 RepID=A0A9E2BKG0_PSYF1|nr:hypothetical protein [Candidatus Psychracetigena formicireducens]